METFELAKKLEEEDFAIIKKDWYRFDEQMKENIILSLTTSMKIDEKIKLADYVFAEGEIKFSFIIFNQNRVKIMNKKTREIYLNLAMEFWKLDSYRKHLKQAIQITHNSKAFLTKMGFDNWNEIEQK
ncbi:hypothetical protein [uncultured Polaribacter sp.]|uniref:hypothetical protein n=1 Tax=uncultured Polaribacter sp. TaxID=174711 RepID=UPI00261506A3|nr:hypothetical protein [uncultured Polaribacter sp.]